jgi:hypothetical protein
MIDDEREVEQLMRDMGRHLPIRVQASLPLSENLRQQGIKLRFGEEAQIESTVYLGDMGGIGCAIKWPSAGKDAVVVSLTHLQIDAAHPLAARVQSYQSKRAKRIALSEGGPGGPSSISFRPKTGTGRSKCHR